MSLGEKQSNSRRAIAPLALVFGQQNHPKAQRAGLSRFVGARLNSRPLGPWSNSQGRCARAVGPGYLNEWPLGPKSRSDVLRRLNLLDSKDHCHVPNGSRSLLFGVYSAVSGHCRRGSTHCCVCFRISGLNRISKFQVIGELECP